MDEKMKIELNDEQLDAVSGGYNLDAWWSTGRQGAPACTKHFNTVIMIPISRMGSFV